jgi:hypothetical protein
MTQRDEQASSSILEWIRAGETIHLGGQVWLDADGLSVGGEQIPLNTIRPLSLDEQGNVVVQRLGVQEPWKVVPAGVLEDVDLVLDVVNRLVKEVPYLERRSVTGWPPGSVGDVSARLGTDVRELWMAGYTDREIRSVLSGERTLEDLLASRPRRRQSRRMGRRKRPHPAR